jgi:hypothetical protein
MQDKKARARQKAMQIALQNSCGAGDDNELEMLLKLEALDAIFSQSQEHAEKFHALYVQPLLDENLGLETALDLLVAGVMRPN